MDAPIPTPPPLPVPPPLPPGAGRVVWRSQEQTDREHLRLLMIFHYVSAGLGLLGIGGLVFEYFFFIRMFNNPAFTQRQGGVPLPPEFMTFFGWILLVFGLLLVLKMVLETISGWCIHHRKARVFSLIVAGLNCLSIPLGTVLGVFTIMILQRPTVQRLYDQQSFSAGPSGPTV